MFWLGFASAFVILGLISVVGAIVQVIKLKKCGHNVEIDNKDTK